MRKFNLCMLFVMTMSLVTLTGCSSDDDNVVIPPALAGGPEFLTATIDGVNFEAAQSPAVIVGAQNTNGVLAVQGGTNNGTTINMVISNYTGVGTYITGDSVSNNNSLQYLTLNGILPTTWASNLATAALGTLMSGTIEVTLDDGAVVEGTFSFEGYNASDMTTKVITNGTFKANID